MYILLVFLYSFVKSILLFSRSSVAPFYIDLKESNTTTTYRQTDRQTDRRATGLIELLTAAKNVYYSAGMCSYVTICNITKYAAPLTETG